jgi:hypothetical protein
VMGFGFWNFLIGRRAGENNLDNLSGDWNAHVDSPHLNV